MTLHDSSSASDTWSLNRHALWCTGPVFIVLLCTLESGWRLRKLKSAVEIVLNIIGVSANGIIVT